MTLSRKQREIAARHALFLEIADSILAEEGFHLLTMERIAEIAEYSKGTVYQHFTCKEEILIQLCIRCMKELHALFEKAAAYEGSQRDRVVAVFYAHQLWSRTGNNQTDLMLHLSMHGVREKVTDESRNEHDRLEHSLVRLVEGLVLQAIDNGELKKQKHMQAADIVFGLWSLSTGGQMLHVSDLPLEDLGISEPNMTMLRTLVVMLNGLNWQPLHKEAHLKKLLKLFNTELFAEQYQQIVSATNKNSTNASL